MSANSAGDRIFGSDSRAADKSSLRKMKAEAARFASRSHFQEVSPELIVKGDFPSHEISGLLIISERDLTWIIQDHDKYRYYSRCDEDIKLGRCDKRLIA